MTGLDLGQPSADDQPRRRVSDYETAPPVSARDGWLKFLIPILLAALVSYFTAQGTIQVQVATIKATEENHFQEVLRRLDLIQRWQDRQDAKR